MMRLLKESAYAVAVLSGITRAATRFADHKAVVLAYHDVFRGGLNSVLNFDGLHVRVARFERQMRYLAKHYDVVPLDDLLAAPVHRGRGKPLAAITFDDGYRDTYRYAVPILRRFGFPAMVFIVTDFLVHGQPFWWDRLWATVDVAQCPIIRVPVRDGVQCWPLVTTKDKQAAVQYLTGMFRGLTPAAREAHLSRMVEELGVDQHAMTTWTPISAVELRDMMSLGISVGSHGRSHDSLINLSREHLREELIESKRILESLTGRPVWWLSYPYGHFSREVAEVAAQAGYRGAVTTIEGLNDGIRDPYAIRRFGVDDRLSFAHFQVAISGLRDVLKAHATRHVQEQVDPHRPPAEAAVRLKEAVRDYWELNPCGASSSVVGPLPRATREWFDRIEEHHYRVEPFIHAVAQFTRHQGKRMLEIGVGTGTDFLQWARAGTRCVGVDITDEAVQLTKTRLACYGFTPEVTRADAEFLPFPDASFDLVYSWGVLHHTPNPSAAIREIRRVLRPGGTFIGMMYHRRSVLAFKFWVWYGLLRGRPWRSFADVLWHHMESLGTKAYTLPELRALFREFSSFHARPILTPYDTKRWPRFVSAFLPDAWGWFTAITATR